MTGKTIHVEVAYALPDRQKLLMLQVPVGTTALQAVHLSNIGEEFPDLEVDAAPMGIFGQALGVRGMPTPDQYLLREGDRVEIYRPLIADPKEVRKQRAAEAAAKEAKKTGAADEKPD